MIWNIETGKSPEFNSAISTAERKVLDGTTVPESTQRSVENLNKEKTDNKWPWKKEKTNKGLDQHEIEQKEQEMFDKLHASGGINLKEEKIPNATLEKFIQKFPDKGLYIKDETLTDRQLIILSKANYLSLDIKRFENDKQAVFLKFRNLHNNLYLQQITKLSDKQVQYLCVGKGNLVLPKLESITTSQAITFRNKKEGRISLGIEKITDQQLEELSKNMYEIELKIKNITDRQANILSRNVNTERSFTIDIETITPQQKAILSRNKNIIIDDIEYKNKIQKMLQEAKRDRYEQERSDRH